jgi:hypothetical protein
MDEFGRRVDEQFGHIGESFGGQPAEPAEPRQPAQPTPPARPTQPTPPARPTQPARPERLAVRVAISGSGALDAGQGLHVQGSVRPEAGGRAGAFELSARGDAETVRRPDGTWVRYDGAAGPLGLLFQSGGVGAVLRAGGEARLVGRTTIDGATVDEYAFTIDALPGAGASGRWTVHAFVDGRKLVRRMSVQATGALGRETGYATSLTLNLSRFGRATVPTGPAGVSAHVSATSRSSVVLGPLAPGARAALGG